MLRALFEEMPGIKPDDVTILIATGTHRTNTRAELERMLGHDIVANYTVVNHDSATTRRSLISVTRTPARRFI